MHVSVHPLQVPRITRLQEGARRLRDGVHGVVHWPDGTPPVFLSLMLANALILGMALLVCGAGWAAASLAALCVAACFAPFLLWEASGRRAQGDDRVRTQAIHGLLDAWLATLPGLQGADITTTLKFIGGGRTPRAIELRVAWPCSPHPDVPDWVQKSIVHLLAHAPQGRPLSTLPKAHILRISCATKTASQHGRLARMATLQQLRALYAPTPIAEIPA